MTVREVIERMNLEVLTGEVGLDKKVEGGCSGDLLSFVMAHAKENDMWITIQGHINSVAVASLTGVALIVLAEKSKADDEMIRKAIEEDIPIASTSLSSFDFVVAYSKQLL